MNKAGSNENNNNIDNQSRESTKTALETSKNNNNKNNKKRQRIFDIKRLSCNKSSFTKKKISEAEQMQLLQDQN